MGREWNTHLHLRALDVDAQQLRHRLRHESRVACRRTARVRRLLRLLLLHSDEKVANRDTKVWHLVKENGY